MKWCFIVFLVYLVSLFFRRERIPGSMIESLCASSIPSNMVFHCESASFGFRKGLDVNGIRLYDVERKNSLLPVFAAESVSIRIFERFIRIVGAKFPRLQDSYYEEGGYAEPLGYGDWGFRFPKIRRLRLELIRPVILGASPERVVATVDSRPTCLSFSDIHLSWGGQGAQAQLDGVCTIDLDAKRVKGAVKGEAAQANIRPLIDVLDLPLVLEYMDSFTAVEKPVPAGCAWDVDLGSNEFTLDLELHPLLGRYNNVPMMRADGSIGLHVSFPVRDGVRGMDYETTVGPLYALDKKNRPLNGIVTVRGSDDVVHIHFDAESSLPLLDILNVIDYLNDGELESLVCDTPPFVKVKGVLAADVAHQADNDLRGTVSFAKGSLFGIPLFDAESEFAYIGDTVYLSGAKAKGKEGGLAIGSARLSFPELDPDRASFALDVTYSNGSVAELADFFQFDAGDKHGEAEGEMSIRGPIGTNVVDRLNGKGQLKVKNGHLAQMKLFMGLTELLAREVPGVDKIVNQSSASCTFTIENGVFKSDDILIEGGLFSIAAQGEYDIVNDNLDFTVKVLFLKNESMLGRYLIRPIMWPFTKLLMEFKATGSIDDPAWDYISVLDRVM